MEMCPAILFSVKDRGVGIPENELKSVFDKFIQSSGTKTGAGGTGLGLAICNEIIKDHRGEICAENNREGGAVFSFMLPCEQ
jgi:two-component system, sensor histidine kinase ChiS